MTESYATNQWFNLPSGVAGGALNPKNPSLSHTSLDNPKFMFPGPVRRNLGGGSDTTIQRGFIRSLLSEVPGVNLPSRRFFFQFNPTSILRAVTVQSGMMNPLLQDPSQFSVATPGNATFNFELLLNREMEVNSKTPTTIDPELRRWLRPDDQIARPNDPQAVGDLGVLADLVILDTIIGQGISQDTVQALAKIYNISSTWEASDQTSGASVAQEPPMSEADANERLQRIIGNSAFLVSTPVRIVFSSLFMVDGFIQSSSVMFNKFNNSMVPTMCTINIGVEAKYIGFAQKDTYLTESLRTMAPNPDQGASTPTVVATPETHAELVNAVKTLPQYLIAVGGTQTQSHPDNWDANTQAGVSNGYSDMPTMFDYNTFLLRFGFMQDMTDPYVGTYLDDTSKVSTITKWLFKQSRQVTVSHSAEVRVYRAFTSDIERDAAVSSGVCVTGLPIGPQTRHTNDGVSVNKDVLLLEVKSPTVSASDFSSWQKFHAFGGPKDGWFPYSMATKHSDTALDNYSNTVYESAKNAGRSGDDAQHLYATGQFRNNATQNIPIVVEITVNLTVSSVAPGQTSPDTVSVSYVKNIVEKNASRHLYYKIKPTSTTGTATGTGGVYRS